MSKLIDFSLPDVGEGLTEATIVRWMVSVGDTICMNDPIVEIETVKSLVELPAPFDGVVHALCAEVGEVVSVGSVILTLSTDIPSDTNTPQAAPQEDNTSSTQQPNLVGYGSDSNSNPLRRKRRRTAQADTCVDQPINTHRQEQSPTNTITPSNNPLQESVHPVDGMRKAIAQNITASKFTAPHVTVFLEVDATRTLEYTKQLKQLHPDLRISPLLIVAKAVLWAIARNPIVNSTWEQTQYRTKHYVNLGIAATTPRGLMVPNIKHAHAMDLLVLATAMHNLVKKAKAGTCNSQDLAEGTFTITNIGSFGIDSGTPILMPSEVGILAFGAIKPKPWVYNGSIAIREITTLSVSFDHRLIDGDVASKFLTDVGSILQEPALLIN